MGLNSIFDKNAELTSIFNPEKQVFVGDVIHKVTIAVDEKGSKASAATGNIYIYFLKQFRFYKNNIFLHFILILNEIE